MTRKKPRSSRRRSPAHQGHLAAEKRQNLHPQGTSRLDILSLNISLVPGGDALAKKAPNGLWVCSGPVLLQSLSSTSQIPHSSASHQTIEDLVPPGPSCNDSCPIQGFLSCRGHADQGQAGKETASWGSESPEDVRFLGRWSRGSSLLPVQGWEASRADNLIPDSEAVSASLILGSWLFRGQHPGLK